VKVEMLSQNFTVDDFRRPNDGRRWHNQVLNGHIPNAGHENHCRSRESLLESHCSLLFGKTLF
jgi:hypothetical protein